MSSAGIFVMVANEYDYQVRCVFIGPGQIVGDDDNGTRGTGEGWALLFHPDLLLGTSLGRKMKD
ncbi:MAG: hypothetical protein ACLU4N_17815 [Butyricimonas faecihominis]